MSTPEDARTGLLVGDSGVIVSAWLHSHNHLRAGAGLAGLSIFDRKLPRIAEDAITPVKAPRPFFRHRAI
jgi:hypothetical protein